MGKFNKPHRKFLNWIDMLCYREIWYILVCVTRGCLCYTWMLEYVMKSLLLLIIFDLLKTQVDAQ